jgi:hypothetical protein
MNYTTGFHRSTPPQAICLSVADNITTNICTLMVVGIESSPTDGVMVDVEENKVA